MTLRQKLLILSFNAFVAGTAMSSAIDRAILGHSGSTLALSIVAFTNAYFVFSGIDRLSRDRQEEQLQ